MPVRDRTALLSEDSLAAEVIAASVKDVAKTYENI